MKRINLTRAAAVMTAGMVLGACGDTGDGTKENVRETAKNFVLGAGVNGEWTAGCADSEILDASVKRTFSFKGNELKKIYSFYESADCKDKIATVIYQGSYELGRDDKKRDDYRNVELEYNSVRVQAINETGKNLLETVNFCGVKEWAVGQELDVTKEAGGLKCPLTATPRKEFDLVKQDDKKLFFGAGGAEAPTDPANRPDDVDQETVFERD